MSSRPSECDGADHVLGVDFDRWRLDAAGGPAVVPQQVQGTPRRSSRDLRLMSGEGRLARSRRPLGDARAEVAAVQHRARVAWPRPLTSAPDIRPCDGGGQPIFMASIHSTG